MTAPTRRLHARYLCRLPFVVLSPRSAKPVDGEILNIGMGGAHLRVHGTLSERQKSQLQVTVGGETFLMHVLVAWFPGPDPKDPTSNLYGVRFPTDDMNQLQVKVAVDRVRSQGGPAAPRVMRNYWNL